MKLHALSSGNPTHKFSPLLLCNIVYTPLHIMGVWWPASYRGRAISITM